MQIIILILSSIVASVFGEVGDLTQIENSPALGELGDRLAARLNEIKGDKDYFVMQTITKKYLAKYTNEEGFTVYPTSFDIGQWFTEACGDVIVAGANNYGFRSFLKTGTTVSSAVSDFSRINDFEPDMNAGDNRVMAFTEDCSKFYIMKTTSDSSTSEKPGFRIYDVNTATAELTFNSLVECPDSVCNDGSATAFDNVQQRFSISGDGQHVFMGIISRTNAGRSDAGGVVHLKYDGSTWTASWMLAPLDSSGYNFGEHLDATGKTLFVTYGLPAAYVTGHVIIYDMDLNGDYVHTGTLSSSTYGSYSARAVTAYNSERVCTNGGTSLDVFDRIDGTWTRVAEITGPGGWLNPGDCVCGFDYAILNADYVGTSPYKGRMDAYELPEAPIPPPGMYSNV